MKEKQESTWNTTRQLYAELYYKDKAIYKHYHVAFKYQHDADVIDKLASVDNVNDYLRKLIREDIAKK